MAANNGTPAAGGSAPVPAPTVQNIDIRVPKNQNKKLAIMRFNGSMGIDFTKWTHTKMERENNQVQFKGFNEDMPKFGAGSEYGREAREEARRKKYGIISKKYNPENQPWILQHGGKTGKKFRGVRDGGINENASYYVFTQAPDGVFEAFPVQEQYSFQAVQNYKPLSIEEAEEGYNMRNKTYNMFNVMMRKRLRKADEDAEEEGEEEGEGKGKSKKKKGVKDSRFGDELDDMMASSDDDSSDGDDDDDDGENKKKKKKGKKPVKPKKKRKNASDDEALEDSDDGDGEGRELDYISSSDADESDVEKEEAKDGLKGVAEEDALRKLLNSDEEDEDEEKEEEEDKDKEEEDAEGAEDQPGDKPSKDEKGDKKKKKEKKKNKDKKPRNEDYGSSSDSGADSSGSELEKAKPSPKMKSGSANSSRSATPTKPLIPQPETTLSDSKRKGMSEAVLGQAAKKPRLEMASAALAASAASAASSSSANEGVNEESVRRYLSRKPMTTTELLQKFKSKRTGLTSEQLVPHIAQILKKINPVKQTIKGKMYLSIKG